jgi:adenylate kinase
MRMILMGPPGSGKGTQAKVVAAQYAIPAISTGDIFRAGVAGRTALALEAQRYMRAGDYVPDEVTNAMVRNRIGMPDAQSGFLLDGYPRTLPQVDELDAMLRDIGALLDCVVCLTVDEDELVPRLLHRAYLEGRPDDTEAVIRHRQKVYAEQTEPLLSVYRKRGLLVEVDGAGEMDLVSQRVLSRLEQRGA